MERLAAWVVPTVDRIVRQTGGRVLDVGCGEQPLRQIVESAGAAYVGFDVEQNAQGSVQVLGFLDRPLVHPWPDAEAAYDVVLCTEVLEHVLGWPQAFSNLRRLTKDGGHLVLTVPFAFPLHMEPIDYLRTTKFAIPKLAAEHGFEVLELQSLGDGADVLVTMLEDLSILPASRSLTARVVARIARQAKRGLAALLRKRQVTLTFNSNFYLANAAVLRAI